MRHAIFFAFCIVYSGSVFSNFQSIMYDFFKTIKTNHSCENYEDVIAALQVLQNVKHVKKSYTECIHAPVIRKLCTKSFEQNDFIVVQNLLTMHLYRLLLIEQIEQSKKRLSIMLFDQTRYNFKGLHAQVNSHQLTKASDVLFHKLELIVELEAEFLGRCLFCKNQIDRMYTLDQLDQQLKNCLMIINSFLRPSGAVSNNYFDELVSLDFAVQEKNSRIDTCIKKYVAPMRQVRLYGITVAATIMSAACLAYQSKDRVNLEKIERALYGFYQDFIAIPLRGLKESLWDRPHVEVKKFDLGSVPENAWGCYTPEKAIKYLLQTPLYNGNKLIEVIEKVIQGQKINYYLSAIVPVYASLYIAYRNGTYYYNHESFFKPIRMILRSIDIFYNQNNSDHISFMQQGFLYTMVSQIFMYIDCLNYEEREMMKYDLLELISYDMTIQQKQKVLDRMYHTYQFLK